MALGPLTPTWEESWWGDCTNTYGEETKQLSYAHRMGLKNIDNGSGHWPLYDLQHKNILDIGGGPSSMLLKAINRGPRCLVADPSHYPAWTAARYERAGITYLTLGGEQLDQHQSSYDEVWIYNVLQHVEDPERIIRVAWGLTKCIRLFDWIDLPPHQGHPQELKQPLLERWLGSSGTVEFLRENGCHGSAFYGVFTSPPPPTRLAL